MSIKTNRRFSFYDTETSGISTFHDQIVQFAGIATDEDLQFIPGDEMLIDVKLRPDVVPSPMAFAVHGISPSRLEEQGVSEFDAAHQIRQWFLASDNSVMTGYNSLNFDDEMVRNMLYRNMLPTYTHEYQNGNGRMDIFRLVMLVYALRPELIKFPVDNEGRVSLKLGNLCAANGIELKHAHDARFDVLATIDLARIIKDKSPKLWDYYLNLTNKHYAAGLVDSLKPVVMVSNYLPREQGHMTMALPVIYDAKSKSKMICIDLRQDPTELLSMEPAEIRRRTFGSSDDLEAGEGISLVRSITVNKQPLIADPVVLRGRDDIVNRSGLNIDKCMEHMQMIKADSSIRERLQEAMIGEFEPCKDVYEGIYSLGFMSREEENIRARLRWPQDKKDKTSLPALAKADPFDLSTSQIKDGMRMLDLSLRAKWNFFGEHVLANKVYSESELSAWTHHLNDRWEGKPKGRHDSNLEMYHQAALEVRASIALDDQQQRALDELEIHVNKMTDLRKSLVQLQEKLANPEKKNASPEKQETNTKSKPSKASGAAKVTPKSATKAKTASAAKTPLNAAPALKDSAESKAGEKPDTTTAVKNGANEKETDQDRFGLLTQSLREQEVIQQDFIIAGNMDGASEHYREVIKPLEARLRELESPKASTKTQPRRDFDDNALGGPG